MKKVYVSTFDVVNTSREELKYLRANLNRAKITYLQKDYRFITINYTKEIHQTFNSRPLVMIVLDIINERRTPNAKK